jgi:hypothetical protein
MDDHRQYLLSRAGPRLARILDPEEYYREAQVLGHSGARQVMLRDRIETAAALDLADGREALRELRRLGDEVGEIEARKLAVAEAKAARNGSTIPVEDLDRLIPPVPCRRTRERLKNANLSPSAPEADERRLP